MKRATLIFAAVCASAAASATYPVTVTSTDPVRGKCIPSDVDPAPWRGRIVSAAVEAKGEVGVPTQRWQGGKFMLCARADGKWDWPQAHFPNGKGPFGWRRFSFEHFYHWDADKMQLVLGMQAAAGTITFREPKFETVAAVLDLRQAANRGYADGKAGDGKGGWTDEGPRRDAGGFDFRAKRCGGLPFRPLDPALNGGRACIALPAKPTVVTLPGHDVKGRAFILLHALADSLPAGAAVGTVEFHGRSGKVQRLAVKSGEDVGSWLKPQRFGNAFPAAQWKTGDGSAAALYASKWTLDHALGEIEKIIIRTKGAAGWMVVAGSVLPGETAWKPAEPFSVKEGPRWRRAARGDFPCTVRPGSALDLSALHPDKISRVELRKGRFVDADSGRRMRFNGDCQMYEVMREDPQEWCAEAKRRGFNMVRLHYLDWMLSGGAESPLKFNKRKDAFFAFLAACNRHGIYVNFDVMASPYGWTPGDPWTVKSGERPKHPEWWVGKREIYFHESSRANWRDGARTLLMSRNPLTGNLVRDEPCLIMAVAFNEQEFAFSSGPPFTDPAIVGRWRAYLSSRYATPSALNAAWGTSYASIADVPPFTHADMSALSTVRGRDTIGFIDGCMAEMQDWYLSTFRGLTKRTYMGVFNMAQGLRTVSLRRGDYVAINAYHAHPLGATIDISSDISRRAGLARTFAASHLAGKPLVITEYGHVFWNPHRYEQGFIMGGYGALNGFDGMTAFARSVTARKDRRRATSFDFRTDPVMAGANFVTALLYGRGDVRESPLKINFTVDRKALTGSEFSEDAMSSEQSALALVGELRVHVDGAPPEDGRSLTMPAAGGNSVFFHSEGYQLSAARKTSLSGVMAESVVAELRRKGLLSAANRTDPARGVYESATGELYLDAPRRFMAVDTPRFQGVASVSSNAAVRLKDVEVVRQTTDGCLFVAAVDGEAPITRARRLVIGYLTNALNDGMKFDGAEPKRVIDMGKMPVLLETGAFELNIKSEHAANLRCHALDFSGERFAELPVRVKNGRVTVSCDTAKLPEGVAFFFELVN